ncbi:MAG: hypothetical protein NDI90_03475 [Nitrospira sp. BO4]|jgi:hypothetical protein|nr:hypothetical protein [Nitrospira sp. BO4]
MLRKSLRLATVYAVASLVCTSAALAEHPSSPLTVAVFGGWPYSSTLKTNAPLLYNSVNNDPDVSLVIHVGDIHSGSQPCTGAGLSPIPTAALPHYNQEIFDIFQKFTDPFVYTPGDNEWTDCHKAKESTSGYPLNELAAVRQLFFPVPGYTIGSTQKEVTSQAQEFTVPADAQFVENVMWTQSNVVFITLNIPGSNNDGLPWSGGTGSPFLNESARQQEVTDRNAANLRWLNRAFKIAQAKKAGAVVIAIQADMWDLTATAAGGDGLTGYRAFVQALATKAVAYGGPVLLLNGDTHLFRVDRPLDPTDRTGCVNTTTTTGCAGGVVLSPIHSTQPVPNLTRITVQGSTNVPNEWLKLTINPTAPNVFTYQNVCYSECP